MNSFTSSKSRSNAGCTTHEMRTCGKGSSPLQIRFAFTKVVHLSKWVGLLSLFILWASRPAHAQHYPRWEAFTGFSYAHVDFGQQSVTFQPTGQNYYGMHVNASYNPRRYLRIILCDFGVQMGKTTINLSPEHADLRTSQVLFGPEFVQRFSSSTVFAHALIGVTNTRLVSSIGGSDIIPDVARRTNLAFGFGGGVDFHLTRLLAIRAVQGDYIPARLSGNWENSYRISSGVVFTFDYKNGR